MSLVAGTNKTMHPYPEWKRVSFIYFGIYGYYVAIWIVNLFIDNNAGFFHRFVIWNAYLMLFAPVATFVGALKASGSYGT